MSAILLPFCFLLFVLLGATYGGLAIYQYFRVEREADIPRLPVALILLGLQYLLMFSGFHVLRGDVLAPMILMLFTAMSLIAVIWLGLAAHTVDGRRIALSGVFTFLGYACFLIAIRQ
jgi:hypothetical protein